MGNQTKVTCKHCLLCCPPLVNERTERRNKARVFHCGILVSFILTKQFPNRPELGWLKEAEKKADKTSTSLDVSEIKTCCCCLTSFQYQLSLYFLHDSQSVKALISIYAVLCFEPFCCPVLTLLGGDFHYTLLQVTPFRSWLYLILVPSSVCSCIFLYSHA